jgi:Family of unknown function (DUF6496)
MERRLRSGRAGKGGRVRRRKQPIAIGLSEARKKGAKVPAKKSQRRTDSQFTFMEASHRLEATRTLTPLLPWMSSWAALYPNCSTKVGSGGLPIFAVGHA